jgi:hypothetical protein
MSLSLGTNEVRSIVTYCSEEVKRQQRFAPQVGNMVDAWMDALDHQYHGGPLTIEMIERWGRMVEPRVNENGFRTVPIYVGNGFTAIPKVRPELILIRLERLIEIFDAMTALEAYLEFEEIHPFRDGNGRTGKIILNWQNGTLLDPIFPPNDIFGDWISNP